MRWPLTCNGALAIGLFLLLGAADSVTAQSSAPSIVGGEREHVVTSGQTWQVLGSRYGIEPAVLADLNGLTLKSSLKAGRTLQIDTRHIVPTGGPPSGVVINVPQRMLFLREAGQVMASYPIACGRPSWQTFLGSFHIGVKEVDPAWDVPVSIQEEMRRAGRQVVTRVPPGPQNPLGKYWLGLSVPGYGIHGTNAPSSIYHHVTHGCIRLHPDDIADLFPRVTVGTLGEIVYESLLLAIAADDSIVLEAHRDVYRREVKAAEDIVRERARALGVETAVDWEAVGAALTRRDGRLVPVGRTRPTPE